MADLVDFSKSYLINDSIQEDESFFVDEVTKLVSFPQPLELKFDKSSASVLVQEDPGVKAAQILFSEFVNIFVSNKCDGQLWHEIAHYERACAEQVHVLEKMIKKVPQHHLHFPKTQQMLLLMTGERNTWRLLNSLFSEGIFLNGDEDVPVDVTLQQTDKSLVTQLYDTNSEMRLSQLVIDWLEKNALDQMDKENFDHVEYFGSRHIAWENTTRKIKNQEQMPGSSPSDSSKVLDIDVSLRSRGVIHELDEDEDQRLIHAMFSCSRAGQIADAQDLAGKSGQYWKAAILEGWKLHHDTNLQDQTQRKPIIGNQFRDMWKAVAWRAAGDKNVPKYERSMYGSLCGHLDSMRNVCQSWEDLLWAYMKTLVDQRVEETLRENSSHIRFLQPLPKDYPEEKFTLEAVFQSIEAKLGSVSQENLYHVIQKFLILDDTGGLIDATHHWWTLNLLTPHHLRCMTHLLLILKRCGMVPTSHLDKMADILSSCVKETMERGDIDQVAWYSSVLPKEIQVKTYAQFLVNIFDEDQRKHALHLASLVGLDVSAITSTVVTNIRLAPGPDSCNAHEVDLTVDDYVKVNAIDWLLFNEAERPEALRQANAIMRSFLIDRKTAAAKSLFQRIPTNTIDSIIKAHQFKTGTTDLPPHVQNRVREYLCFKTFLDAQECFTDWFDHYHQKKPPAPPKLKAKAEISEQLAHAHTTQVYNANLDRWNKLLHILTKKACEHLYNVLLFPDGGWMVDSNVFQLDEEAIDVEYESWSLIGGRPLDMCPQERTLLEHLDLSITSKETNRNHQLSNLRAVYIPQVASLLQNILHYTKEYKECLQLSDLVASERHGLYKCFSSEELQRFILKLQDSSKELLDMNLDALGYQLN